MNHISKNNSVKETSVDEEAVFQSSTRSVVLVVPERQPEPITDVEPPRRSNPTRRSVIDRSGRMSIIDRDKIVKPSNLDSLVCDDESDSENVEQPGPRESILTRLVKHKRVSIMTDQAYSRLFGDSYNARESSFVLMAGSLIAFNSGFVNGCCVSGLLDPDREASQSVAGFTSKYTKSALAIAAGKWESYGLSVALIMSYMLGAFICGLITPKATSYQIEPSYGPTFLLGGLFLLAASILAALEFETFYVFCLAAAANGIQNGIASIYSANLIRCSLTGSSTDIAITCAQALRGNRKGVWKAVVLAIIVASFWLGGIISFYAVSHFLTYTLLFNAGLMCLVGFSLVAFLVREIGVSVEAAIMGNWRWKKVQKLMDSLRTTGDLEGEERSSTSLFELFAKIDVDGSGAITPDELLEALMVANVAISAKEVRTLMKTIDANGDGVIDREEWSTLVERIEGKGDDDSSISRET